MAANKYGIDLASLYSTAEAVKGARTRNRLAALDLQEREREIEERPMREKIAREQAGLQAETRYLAAQGDQDAQQQLMAIDPEGAPDFLDAVYKADDRQLAAIRENVENVGRLSNYVLQGGTPEEQQRRYSLMRQNVNCRSSTIRNFLSCHWPGRRPWISFWRIQRQFG